MSGSNRAYWDMLQVGTLLQIQGGLEHPSGEVPPDELHFVVVHQVYELWFKLILSELREARDHLGRTSVPEVDIPYVVSHLRRVSSVLSLCVEQWNVMETLSPQDFLAFRARLGTASGFQSHQLRMIEMLLGIDEPERRSHLAAADPVDPIDFILRATADCKPESDGAFVHKEIAAARTERTFYEALRAWLHRTPIDGSTPDTLDDSARIEAFLEAFIVRSSKPTEARDWLFAVDAAGLPDQRLRRIRAAVLFIESYRALPLLAWPRLLLDTVVEVEQQFTLWRARHARMVERVIGKRPGTGGSDGVAYLDRTARYRIFKDLWEVRGFLLPESELPPLQHKNFYYRFPEEPSSEAT